MKKLDKQTRYAMIKGKAEKRNELLKPWIYRSLEVRGLTERYIESILNPRNGKIPQDDINF